ncbi:LamG-like jellyroll fold domain-containing protein [Marinomonas sp. THO17]|uniref:LamG-like jellyroll fold domain-containing protein n=1 Tax=Marinomonas sp. THO17 TaxID=3149048 RepID=UPI00336BC813
MRNHNILGLINRTEFKVFGNIGIAKLFKDTLIGSALVSSIMASSSLLADFIHPGLLHTQADFDRMKDKVAASAEPWLSGYNELTSDDASKLGQSPNPLTKLVRGGDGSNFGTLVSDIHKMYAMGLRWKVSGDTAYADSVVQFMNAWSSTLTEVTGNNDRYLAAGLYGYELANIGEMMRDYSGWASSDQTAYKNMLVNLFYPISSDFLKNHNGACLGNYWANWDMISIAGIVSIAIFADDQDKYDEAISYLHDGDGNGALKSMVYYKHPGYMWQYQESGRDQGHSTLGVSMMGVIGQTIHNQGDDVFAYNNKQVLAISEYVAKYNLNEEVPYTPYGQNCTGASTRQDVISDDDRGIKRPAWELIYNYYENILGVAAPWSKKMAAEVRPEGFRNGDELGYGTLTFSRDRITEGGAPSDLSVDSSTSSITLSWWGAVGADSYNVKRATSASGAYSTVTTVQSGNTLTYSDNNITSGQNYYYKVSAVKDSVESIDSNVAVGKAGPRLLFNWTFDSESNNKVSNEVGFGDAVLKNGSTLTDGVHGKAVFLDGDDDYVELPKISTAGLVDYTISTWFKQSEGRVWAQLFALGENTLQYMTFIPKTNSNETRYATTKTGQTGEDRLNISSLSSGTWRHVAISVSGKTVKLYINGEEKTSSDSVRFNPNQLGILPVNMLGKAHDTGWPMFKGAIDEFRIYRGALTDQEIQDIYNWDTNSMANIPNEANNSPAYIEDGIYKIVARKSGLALTPKDGGTSNNTLLVQDQYSGADDQQWTLTNLGSNYYKVMGTSGRMMDDYSFRNSDSSDIGLWDDNGGDNQLWGFTRTKDGYFHISSKYAASLSLDPHGATISSDKEVKLLTYDGAEEQQWQLIKVK